MLSTVIVGVNIPTNYSRHLPHIVARAKSVLHKRNNAQIEQAALFVDAVILDFILHLKEKHKGNYRRYIDTELQARHDFDILKTALKSYDFANEVDFPNATAPEIFAVFALSQVAKALELMSCSIPDNLEQSTHFSFQLEQIREFNDLLLCATEAAEHAKLTADTQKIISQNEALVAENHSLRNITIDKVQSEAKRVASERSRQAAIASHAKDYALQEEVNNWLISRCQADPNFINRSSSRIASEIFRLDIIPREYETLVKYVSAFKKSTKNAA